MKANEIRKEVLEYIASDIQCSVARLGINTTVEFSLKKDRLEMSSTTFQTMPMIFKSIYLWGNVWLEDDKEHDGYTRFTLRIYYGYRHWDGGSNACSLGTVYYEIDNNIPKRDCDYCLYIRRIGGIEI